MLHIKTYEGLLDRFKKVDAFLLIKSIESKLPKEYSLGHMGQSWAELVKTTHLVPAPNSEIASRFGKKQGDIIDTIILKYSIPNDSIEIEIKRDFKYPETLSGELKLNICRDSYNFGISFRGLVENVADKCIELIGNTVERFSRDHKTTTNTMIVEYISKIEERKEKVKKLEYIRDKGKQKLQDYYKNFFEKVDIVSIKDYLYDLYDILGEYEITKIESDSVGYQIRWKDVDLLNFKKSMKVHSFKDYKDSFQTLELIKEFAHRIKFDYDIDVDYDHTKDDIVLTLLEELPNDLKEIWQHLFAYTSRGRPRRA
jgi:hypothetical protein